MRGQCVIDWLANQRHAEKQRMDPVRVPTRLSVKAFFGRKGDRGAAQTDGSSAMNSWKAVTLLKYDSMICLA